MRPSSAAVFSVPCIVIFPDATKAAKAAPECPFLVGCRLSSLSVVLSYIRWPDQGSV